MIYHVTSFSGNPCYCYMHDNTIVSLITWLWQLNSGFGKDYVEGTASLYDTFNSTENELNDETE